MELNDSGQIVETTETVVDVAQLQFQSSFLGTQIADLQSRKDAIDAKLTEAQPLVEQQATLRLQRTPLTPNIPAEK